MAPCTGFSGFCSPWVGAIPAWRAMPMAAAQAVTSDQSRAKRYILSHSGLHQSMCGVAVSHMRGSTWNLDSHAVMDRCASRVPLILRGVPRCFSASTHATQSVAGLKSQRRLRLRAAQLLCMGVDGATKSECEATSVPAHALLRPPGLDALPHPVARAAALVLAGLKMQQDAMFHQRGRYRRPLHPVDLCEPRVLHCRRRGATAQPSGTRSDAAAGA